MGCKYVLLNIDALLQKEYESAESIDELVENYNRAHEQDNSLLDSNTEFFAHCFNLHAWVEHEYDTPLLDVRLAFPLLKALSEVGDVLAQTVFKEEIAKRCRSGFFSVIEYLNHE
ncbi:MAG: Leucine-rich repeat domain protein [Promethearchaeota archaeon]|nr:MAG: Leucine-rich repeat domain protein [Candidatus Lokiarchaeota archaeon]